MGGKQASSFTSGSSKNRGRLQSSYALHIFTETLSISMDVT